MRTKFRTNIPLCKCGCGLPVKRYRKKWRSFLPGHHNRMESMRSMHSKRMQGNTLFLGGVMSEEARRSISKSQTGSGNSGWKGGRTIAGGGYVLVLRPEHPYADVNGYVHEERLFMEEFLGRILSNEETVHHKNEVKADNRIENLQVMTRHEHKSYHTKKRWHIK